jgi:hypothetical protein
MAERSSTLRFPLEALVSEISDQAKSEPNHAIRYYKLNWFFSLITISD